jgi:formylglycine-generating enzyme
MTRLAMSVHRKVTMRSIRLASTTTLAIALASFGCGGNSTDSSANRGGSTSASTNSGGAVPDAGSSSSGAGGTSGDARVPDAPSGQPDVPVGGAGGAGGTGGNPGTGGTTSAGGMGTGGAATGGTSTGGATTSAGGTATGGSTSAGGSTNVGGTTKAGGTTASGGTTSAGGTTKAGGTTASGGTTRTGGTTTTGGTKSSGGSSGTSSTWDGTAPSCSGLAATCGPSGTDDCCKSLLVPGGTFYRGYDAVDFNDKDYPATLADFYLDKYEITVSRFRRFVNAGKGTVADPPAAGDGAHPLIVGSGWNSIWSSYLPADTDGLKAFMSSCAYYPTWTETADSNETMPMNCMDWYTMFAFCAWDGARLATEAELSYAASGGSEQRYFPWSIPATSTTIDDSYAVYCGEGCSVAKVGSKSPKGDGKWGHSDLSGNLWEWTLDSFAEPYANPCSNCAELVGYAKVARGGHFGSREPELRTAFRENNDPVFRGDGIGARCARSRQ